MSDDEKIQAVNVIQTLAKHLGLNEDDVLKNLAEFRTETGIWQNESVRNAASRLEPRIWWQGLCAEQPLESIASRLLSLPVSQAECERTWSCFDRVHTKKTNRMKNDKVVKSVKFLMNLAYASDLVKKKKAPLLQPKDNLAAPDPELSSSSRESEGTEDASDTEVEFEYFNWQSVPSESSSESDEDSSYFEKDQADIQNLPQKIPTRSSARKRTLDEPDQETMGEKHTRSLRSRQTKP